MSEFGIAMRVDFPEPGKFIYYQVGEGTKEPAPKLAPFEVDASPVLIPDSRGYYPNYQQRRGLATGDREWWQIIMGQ